MESNLYGDYNLNTLMLREKLRADESFDIIERHLSVCEKDVCFFYIDGFVKDGEMLRIMQYLLSQKELADAESLVHKIPYIEVEISSSFDKILRSVLSGQAVMLADGFGDSAILLDVRTYPARETSEPETDKVMQGARDGFVETLVTNTALIRRRIRDPRLTFTHFSLGGSSDTDVVVCYMDGVAERDTVEAVKKKISDIKPKSLTLGTQSLSECIVRTGWFNPFPKIRTTERPDAASAQLLEGSVIVLCDTSPLAMIFPTSIFDYLEETDDFYFPPLTGTYLRFVRTVILLLSVVITPLWYLALEYDFLIPEALSFIIPDDPGALPIILQLFLAELAIDGLKIASTNTPDMLSNSLSVVGALLLGDFAITVGWLCPDVILYMAFVAIANFAQQNHELGYAFKFMRMLILGLVWIFKIWGFILGILIFCLAVATNKTALGKRHYLYPLIPFNARDMSRLIIRHRKCDVEEKGDENSNS